MDMLFEDFVLDPVRREFSRHGAEVALEPQVFDLLLYLLRERARVVSKDDLVAHVWHGRVVSDSTVESRLSLLRKALDDDGHAQRLIRTYSRKGIRFIGDVREESRSDRLALAAPEEDMPVCASSGCDDAGRPKVAVLPFVNLSGDPGQDHVADGIAADIIALLARYRSLFVVARSSSFALKGQPVDVRQAGAWLGADYVVAGSFQRSLPQLRITFELVDARDGQAMWTERYERDVDDIFAVQDDIVEKIVGRIEPEIGRSMRCRASGGPPRSPLAWDHFHLGMTCLYKATAQDNQGAQVWLRRAIELDPGFAQAHAFLSYAIVLSMIYFGAPPLRERLDEALAHASRAVELDDRDAAARFTLGRALTVRQQYDDAVAELELATELNPALAIGWCGLADAHVYAGELERAFPLFQRAIDLSPRDPMLWAFLAYRAQAHLFAGEFAQAEACARKAVHVPQCHYWPFAHRVVALGYLGEAEDARLACEQLLCLKPDFSGSWARERLFYVRDNAQLGLYIEGLRRAGVPD